MGGPLTGPTKTRRDRADSSESGEISSVSRTGALKRNHEGKSEPVVLSLAHGLWERGPGKG